MYADLLKGTLSTVLRAEGKKRINKDKNATGSDDASGRVFTAVASAIDAVELETASKETFRNTANAFRAAADELDKAAEQI